MGWLDRLSGTHTSDAEAPKETHLPEPVEGAAPGLAALFERLTEGEAHSVLDLGPATPAQLEVHRQIAHRVRFADLATVAGREGWTEALAHLPAQPEAPYDTILLWDLLDRLPPEGRPALVTRLVELASPDARLHTLVQAHEGLPSHPLAFTLLGPGRIRYTPTGPARASRNHLQSATIERLLDPFQVSQAFTLKVGFREYLAERRP
jgi:hypothetical protein